MSARAKLEYCRPRLPSPQILMIHRLATSRVQVWQLVGLHCWHRTLVQQQVEWTGLAAASDGFAYPRVEWRWRDSLFDDFGSRESREVALDSDVFILSLHLIEPLASTESSSSDARGEPTTRTRLADWFAGNRFPSGQVGLLWDWGAQRCSSLAFATALGFSGVISDADSLRHWLQVMMARAASRMQPAHPLLQNITIPTLSSLEQ